jgi:NAD(P)-dependent dehydrogenase (short-subunit alcohol dehydrogenase family)
MTGMCQDRVCVVTGAARGIGRAHVEALAAEGARVIVNDVDGAAVDEAVAALQASGADAVGHIGDASTVDGAVDLIGTAVDRWSRLDVVVNNAGITRDRMLCLAVAEGWHRGPTAAPVAKAEEVDAVIRPLLAAAAPNADAQGDLPALESQ